MPDVALSPPPSIALPGVTLRPWRVADATAFASAIAASEAHLRAFTPWVVDGKVPGLSIEQRLAGHAAAFERGEEWVYGLFDAASGEVLGGCGLYPRVGPDGMELGYWLAAGSTGRGLATRATAALTRVAFASEAVQRTEIRCDPRNLPSARVPERLGYRLDEMPVGPQGLMRWVLPRADFAWRAEGWASLPA